MTASPPPGQQLPPGPIQGTTAPQPKATASRLACPRPALLRPQPGSPTPPSPPPSALNTLPAKTRVPQVSTPLPLRASPAPDLGEDRHLTTTDRREAGPVVRPGPAASTPSRVVNGREVPGLGVPIRVPTDRGVSGAMLGLGAP